MNGNRVRERAWWQRLQRRARLLRLQVLRVRAEPEVVARGVACGIFAGWLPAIPLFPLQIVTALVLSFLVRGSKIAAFAATWISNPLNWVVFYLIDFKVGSLFSPFGELDLNVRFDDLHAAAVQLADVSWKGLVVMGIGGTMIGVPCAILSYFVALPLIRGYRKRRTLRILRKKTSV
ncbi:Protein of unknown function DUF2062 [Desulfovibrio sp. X2]|uniref:DUF2062 domain-containing protein n=1 Tax=Desulfovibrio sp. X2 TaxID=941449 RepID=UPI000358A990|nr:DUF2062 domain-containing protein [Desulfovibrio sp. X2]EPR42233.1 Protein of unknown function DUF2062 [Desulfovibrio sp. X2]